MLVGKRSSLCWSMRDCRLWAEWRMAALMAGWDVIRHV